MAVFVCATNQERTHRIDGKTRDNVHNVSTSFLWNSAKFRVADVPICACEQEKVGRTNYGIRIRCKCTYSVYMCVRLSSRRARVIA